MFKVELFLTIFLNLKYIHLHIFQKYAEDDQVKLKMMPFCTNLVAVFTFVQVNVAAVVEEIVYRGFLLTSLTKWLVSLKFLYSIVFQVYQIRVFFLFYCISTYFFIWFIYESVNTYFLPIYTNVNFYYYLFDLISSFLCLKMNFNILNKTNQLSVKYVNIVTVNDYFYC